MQIDSYFHRLKIQNHSKPTEQALHDIHLAQLSTIPFENIDVYCGKGISLDKSNLEKKLITDLRGGYCFELNSLLANQLEALGFQVQRLLARRMFERPQPGPLTHMILKVTNSRGQTWLCDVGFGGLAFIAPLVFEINRVDEQFGTSFRLIQHDEFGFVLEKKSKLSDTDEWLPLYCFSGQPVFPGDLEMANFFTASYPESNFKKKLMTLTVTPRERKTLVNNEYTKIMFDEKFCQISSERKQLSNTHELHDLLKNEFAIDLSQKADLNLERCFQTHPPTL